MLAVLHNRAVAILLFARQQRTWPSLYPLYLISAAADRPAAYLSIMMIYRFHVGVFSL